MKRICDSAPFIEGETVMSWVGRIARASSGLDPFSFLNLFELSRKDILEATPEGLDRLAQITCGPREVIERGAYTRIGDRLYAHRGVRFHAEFAGRERTTYCPACLLDDRQPESASKGLRVGRVNWLFEPVRTCPVHEVPLVRRACSTYAERFQDMELVAPDDATLQQMVAQAAHRPVSPLQAYVEQRFDGAAGPAWLDGQEIDQASRACEMLGAVLLFGTHVDLPDLSEDQWDAAGAEGFGFAARGGAGVREALDVLAARFRTGPRNGGPRASLPVAAVQQVRQGPRADP
jgi:hypothetical protein